MKKQKPQKKICRSYATCPDHTCGSCNANPYNSATGATTLDGAGNPLPTETRVIQQTGHEAYPLEAELLPPETNALTRTGGHILTTSISRDDLLAQYRRANAGTLEIIRFGAMLIEIDEDITRQYGKSRFNPDGSGMTLEKWLAENFPEVNYKTANNYKRLAEGLQREFKIPAKMRLTDALPTSDGSAPHVSTMFGKDNDRAIEIREEIWEFVNGKSARQLMFDFGLTAERKPTGGDRRSGMKLSITDKHLRDVSDAKKVWTMIARDLRDNVRTYKSHLLLDPDTLAEVLMQLDIARDAIRAAQGKKK